jgi:hypothetical protein
MLLDATIIARFYARASLGEHPWASISSIR